MKLLRITFLLVLISLTLCFAQQVRIETEVGDIVVELNDDKAPVTVANFL